jgi:hypothetical protein
MGWTAGDLRRVGAAAELDIASYRADGTRRPFVTIWTVVVADAVYVRSGYGPDNPWFRRAVAAGRARVRAGGVERDVTVTHLPADDPAQAGVDAAYLAKYDRYAESVATVTGDHATHVTLRLDP